MVDLWHMGIRSMSHTSMTHDQIENQDEPELKFLQKSCEQCSGVKIITGRSQETVRTSKYFY